MLHCGLRVIVNPRLVNNVVANRHDGCARRDRSSSQWSVYSHRSWTACCAKNFGGHPYGVPPRTRRWRHPYSLHPRVLVMVIFRLPIQGRRSCRYEITRNERTPREIALMGYECDGIRRECTCCLNSMCQLKAQRAAQSCGAFRNANIKVNDLQGCKDGAIPSRELLVAFLQRAGQHFGDGDRCHGKSQTPASVRVEKRLEMLIRMSDDPRENK